jgi:hypothetical protein
VHEKDKQPGDLHRECIRTGQRVGTPSDFISREPLGSAATVGKPSCSNDEIAFSVAKRGDWGWGNSLGRGQT